MILSLQQGLAEDEIAVSVVKRRDPFEFGVKVGLASTGTLKGNLIVGVRAFPAPL